MTPEQLGALKALAAEVAPSVREQLEKRQRRRRKGLRAYPSGPVPAAHTVVRCRTCNATLWAQDAPRDANGQVCCPAHVGTPLHAPSSAYTTCEHCRERVASGVWAYGGEAFGHAWERHAALCAACGFDAVNWLTLMRPEVPKGWLKRMGMAKVLKWHRDNPPKAMRYVQWCKLEHDGRQAAAVFRESVKAELAPAPALKTFDMSDMERVKAFLQSVGLCQ
jgi:hypothetical protein